MSRRWSVSARTYADAISIRRKVIEPGDPGAQSQLTGHRHADVVTSASATAGGGGVAEKWRVEQTLGAAWRGEARGAPVGVRFLGRVGNEPDYQSYSGALQVSFELAQRNAVLTVIAGGGYDRVLPIEAPPGEARRWPAGHGRVIGGVTLSQLLSPRLVLSAGVLGTVQRGRLSNPYRRAIVRTSLFPESHPDARERLSAFVQLSWYLGAQAALHYRLGLYADSWHVLAAIPELVFAQEIARRAVVSLRYRYYTQTRASFWQPAYVDVEPIMSGDLRLAPLDEHTAGVELRVRLSPDRWRAGALGLVAGYDASFLSYALVPTDRIDAHVVNLGLQATY